MLTSRKILGQNLLSALGSSITQRFPLPNFTVLAFRRLFIYTQLKKPLPLIQKPDATIGIVGLIHHFQHNFMIFNIFLLVAALQLSCFYYDCMYCRESLRQPKIFLHFFSNIYSNEKVSKTKKTTTPRSPKLLFYTKNLLNKFQEIRVLKKIILKKMSLRVYLNS